MPVFAHLILNIYTTVAAKVCQTAWTIEIATLRDERRYTCMHCVIHLCSAPYVLTNCHAI